MTSGVPLNGTSVTLMCAAAIHFSVLKCVPLPMPAWPMLIAPGFALMAESRSAIVLYGESTLTTRTFGCSVNGTMSVKSFSVSYGRCA